MPTARYATEAGPSLPSASPRPGSARASTSTAPSVTRRSAPGTSPRSSRATTPSCRAPSTRRASCATTRSTSGWTRRTWSASGAASGATRRCRPSPCSRSRSRSPPRARASRSRRSVIVAALLTVLIAVFAVYIGVQLVRFAKPPTLALTNPPQAVVDVEEDTASYTLRGTSIPGATVSIKDAAKDQPYRVTADEGGRWTADVDLRRGRTSSTSARSIRRPARRPRTRSGCSSPCRSWSSRRQRSRWSRQPRAPSSRTARSRSRARRPTRSPCRSRRS